MSQSDEREIEKLLDEVRRDQLLESAVKSLTSIDRRLASQNKTLEAIEGLVLEMATERKQPDD